MAGSKILKRLGTPCSIDRAEFVIVLHLSFLTVLILTKV
jgi:hypothetical protein